jgi:hypothetical protein
VRTFNFDVMGPIKEVYAGVWLKTIGRYSFKKLRKRERELTDLKERGML